jgi:hypothetical protein
MTLTHTHTHTFTYNPLRLQNVLIFKRPSLGKSYIKQTYINHRRIIKCINILVLKIVDTIKLVANLNWSM